MSRTMDHTHQVPESYTFAHSGQRPLSNMAFRYRNSLQNQSPHPPPLLPTLAAASRYLYPVPDSSGSTSIHSMHYPMGSSRSTQQSLPQSSAYSPELSLSSHSSPSSDPEGPENRRRSTGHPRTLDAPLDPHRLHHNTIETRHSEEFVPAPKRCKLVDTDGWEQMALNHAKFMYKLTGKPDPHPFPVPTVSPGRRPDPGESPVPATMRRKLPTQQHSHPSSRYLTPPAFSRSPGLHSATHSRRSSSVYSSSTLSCSPVPSQAIIASTGRHGGPSPPDSGVSDLGSSTRANSEALDGGDLAVTFDQVHNVPRPILRPRETKKSSPIEQLPREIFMRIMMHCGYKNQVFLKQCSYTLYIAVDLEAIPWEKKAETILYEECYNPRNFPKKTQQETTSDEEDSEADEVDAVLGEETASSRKPAKRKTLRKADATSPTQGQGKTKSRPQALDQWGCYCCYKVLPAHYFEGKLLEDKEGRRAKNNNSGGTAAPESDKKVDMRVEYIQILDSVPGRVLPDWLTKDKGLAMDKTDVEAYVRERMERGVNCDDLRAYYGNISRDTHLVAPLRGINPVFVPSVEDIPRVDRSAIQISKVQRFSNTRTTPQARPALLPTIQSRNSSNDFKIYQPLYKLWTKKSPRGDLGSASYTYEITIPRDARCEDEHLQLPTSPPVGRICLPGPHTGHGIQQPTPRAGDVVSLRRVCIPCGAKFAVYRRDCNRKIISKTDEAWWVCDCPQVRLAEISTGCPTCGKIVVY